MSNSMYDRSEESTQGLEIQLSDPSHLFRHASEITKGMNFFRHLRSFTCKIPILNKRSIVSTNFIIFFSRNKRRLSPGENLPSKRKR